jgi:hypothetical protein
MAQTCDWSITCASIIIISIASLIIPILIPALIPALIIILIPIAISCSSKNEIKRVSNKKGKN